jgi:Bax protein
LAIVNKVLKIGCVSAVFWVNAIFPTVRDEIFQCDRAEEYNSDEHDKILRSREKEAIPPLALKSMPRTNSSSRSDRNFFVKVISSGIRKVNEFVIEQRKVVLSVHEKRQKFQKLSVEESRQFKKICSFYQTCNINELLLRVAPIPVSLAVAQAALESRFGSDKIIHRLNAYFGLALSDVRLVKFDTLFNSIIAYMKTLNVSPCFSKFRQERALMMAKSAKLNTEKLAMCLGNYGTDKNYCNLIRGMIRTQKLNAFD